MSNASALQLESMPGAIRPTAHVADLPAEAGDRRWQALYRVAGGGALLTGLLIPFQIVALIVWQPPLGGTVTDWFKLFNDNPFAGLVSFDLAMMVEQVLLVPIALALFILLRRRSQSTMLITTGLWLLGATLLIAANTGFEMLSLSRGYSDASSDTARAAYLAAGQAALTSYMDRGSAFVMGYLLSTLAGILAGIGMLRTPVFSRWASYAVIGGNVLGLGLFVPVVGIPLAIGSVVILIAWYWLIGWRMLHLPATAVPSASAESAPRPG